MKHFVVEAFWLVIVLLSGLGTMVSESLSLAFTLAALAIGASSIHYSRGRTKKALAVLTVDLLIIVFGLGNCLSIWAFGCLLLFCIAGFVRIGLSIP